MKWLWTSPESGYEWLLVFLAPTILAVLMARALAVLKAPGEIGGLERKRLFRLIPRTLLDSRFIFQYVIPAGFLLGFFLLFLPVGIPVTVVLPSQSLRPGQDQSRWEATWRETWTSAGLDGSSQVLDAGALVDGILGEIATTPGMDWSPVQPTARKRIREEVQKYVEQNSAAGFRELSRVELRYNNRGLERWLIETVELSTLQALLTRFNVKTVVFTGTDRRTVVGMSWAQLPALLMATDASRQVRIQTLPASDPVRLVATHPLRIAPPNLRILSCVFELEGLEASNLVSGELLLSTPQGTNPLEIVITNSTHLPGQLVTVEFVLPVDMTLDLSNGGAAQLKFAGALGDSIEIPGAGKGAEWNGNIVLKSANPARWEASWNSILANWTNSPQMREWFSELGVIVNPGSINFGTGNLHSNAVVIDAETLDRGLCVYPNGWIDATSQLIQRYHPPGTWNAPGPASGGAGTNAPWVAVRGAGGVPSEWGLAGVFFPGGPTLSVTSPGLVVLNAMPLSPHLTNGMNLPADLHQSPIIWRDAFSMNFGSQSTQSVVTVFALDVEKSGVLCESAAKFNSPATDRQKILGFWLELSRAAAASAQKSWIRAESSRKDQPLSVWTENELIFAREKAIRSQLTPFFVGAGIYGAFLAAALRRSPHFERSPN